MRKLKRSLTYLTDFNLFAQKNYLYSIGLVIILFSMAGIPPLGGFFGKYYLFLHSFEVGHILLVVTGMATSVLATYYYLRIIKIMWFEKPMKSRLSFITSFSRKFIFLLYRHWVFTCWICNLKPLNFWNM